MFNYWIPHCTHALRPLLFAKMLMTLVLACSHIVADETSESTTVAKHLSNAFRSAANSTMHSVVTIITNTHGREGREITPEDLPFKLPPDFELPPGLRLPDGHPSHGVGSGIIISETGNILTNSHVVRGADEIWVRFADGVELKALDIRADNSSDLAILRVESDKSFPPARFGNSDDLAIGDWVLAIGSPFGLDATVSAGIISGKGRGVRPIQRGKLIQTDAAINPGNSGGPLINLEGEVVGINTAIASPNGVNAGVGFAIPMNRAKWVAQQLIDSGRVRRAYLGIQIDTVDPEFARENNLDASISQGVLVRNVLSGSPAADAGIEKSDVIISFAGNRVRDVGDLQDAVEQLPFGSSHQVTVNRNGNVTTLDVIVKPLPDESFKSSNEENKEK